MTQRWSLENKKALVTGGTKGIGEAITKEFIHLGTIIVRHICRRIVIAGRHVECVIESHPFPIARAGRVLRDIIFDEQTCRIDAVVLRQAHQGYANKGRLGG